MLISRLQNILLSTGWQQCFELAYDKRAFRKTWDAPRWGEGGRRVAQALAALGGGGGVVQLTQPQQRRVQWLGLRGGGLGREGRKALKRCLLHSLSVRKLAALAEYSRKRTAASMAKRMNSRPRPRLLPSCDLNAAAYFTCMTLFVIVVGPAAMLPCTADSCSLPTRCSLTASWRKALKTNVTVHG